jgi:hypothetical protein
MMDIVSELTRREYSDENGDVVEPCINVYLRVRVKKDSSEYNHAKYTR